MSLLELPLEIVLEIISHIEWGRDQAALACVSQHFRRLIEPLLYSKLVVGDRGHPLQLLRTIVSRPELAAYARSVDVHYRNQPRFAPFVTTNEEWTAIGETVRSLHVPYENDLLNSIHKANLGAIWTLILVLAPNIENLSLQATLPTNWPSLPRSSLEYLGMILVQPQHLAHSFPDGLFRSLRSLEISGICRSRYHDYELAKSLRWLVSYPSLRKVTLSRCDIDPEVPHFWRRCNGTSSNVTALKLYRVSLSMKGLRAILEACKILTNFTFCYESMDGDVDITRIVSTLAQHQSNLVDLRLQLIVRSYCYSHLPKIDSLRQFHKLNHLDINTAILLPPQGRASIFPSSLKVLSICHDHPDATSSCVRDFLGRDWDLPPQLHRVNVYPPPLFYEPNGKQTWDGFQQNRFKSLKQDLRSANVELNNVTDESDWYSG